MGGAAKRPGLWKLALHRVGQTINVGMLHASDERKLAATWIELYAVGERPTPQEVDAFLRELWPGQSARSRRRIVGLWRKVLRNPHHRFRSLQQGSPWRRPFLILEELCDQNDLESVGERLVRGVAASVSAFHDGIERGFSFEAAERDVRHLTAAVRALVIWGASRDMDDSSPRLAHRYQPMREASVLLARCTIGGQTREQERIERLRTEHE